MITGEHRPYNKTKGIFSGVKPRRNFNPLKGGWGAWEVGSRLSYIDLNDGGIKGGGELNLTPGLNWYLNRNVGIMLNYVRAWVDDLRSPDIHVGKAHILQSRFQIVF